MADSNVSSTTRTGNRKSYSGAEILALFWILQEYSDEEHPLSANDVAEKAAQLYGEDMVPGEKKIRNCLKTIAAWSALGTEKARAKQAIKVIIGSESEQTAFHPLRPPRIETVEKSGTTFYFVKRRQANRSELEHLANDFAILMGAKESVEFMPYAIEEKIPTAGQDWPDNGTGRSAEDILAMAARLRKAIKEKKAISYEKAHHIVGPKRGGEYQIRPARGINDAVDENRHAEGQWPFAVKAIDGEFYVLVNATGKRDKFASVRLAEIAELHIVDPEDPRNIVGEPIKLKPACRPELDNLVECYLDGAVLGWGSAGKKARIRMLCKGNGFHDAYEKFSPFEKFEIHKSAPAKALDKEEAALRPKSEQSRQANPWYELTFMAHPYGVELWAKRRVRDVVLLEPKDAVKRVRKYLLDCRYNLGIGLWEQQIGLFDASGETLPDEICTVEGLDDSEKKLIAAYRTAKAKTAKE